LLLYIFCFHNATGFFPILCFALIFVLNVERIRRFYNTRAGAERHSGFARMNRSGSSAAAAVVFAPAAQKRAPRPPPPPSTTFLKTFTNLLTKTVLLAIIQLY